MKTYRGALIGCGFFAQNHMCAWAGLPEAKIAALCDTDIAKARAMAEAFGVEGVYTDAAKMLAETAPDFVDIATTPPSHRALVERAAPKARLVICQKPIADTYAEAEAMVAAAEKAGAAFLIHENFRWQKGFRRMKALIQEGAIGTPLFARLNFRHGFDVYAGQPYLATFPRLALMDIGIHLYDLARHFMGEAETLSCATQKRNPRVAGEDAFTALLTHEGGGVSVVDASFASRLSPEPFPETLAEIEGEAGTLILAQGYRLSIHDAKGRREESAEPEVPAWGAKPWHGVQESVIAFQTHALDVLAGRARPAPSGADNLRTLALALASYDAAEKGARIAMAGWREGGG
jgi:predicted dehydrogenase